jgi:hypothetical protein
MRRDDDNPYGQLDGLTRLDCCSGCGPERCVISGIGVCAHPARSGLQSAMSRDPDVFKRYELARRLLAVQAAEAKEAQTR